MSSEVEVLVDIPMEEWLPLSEKYRQRMPYGLTGFSSIRSQFLNKTKFPDFPVSVTAPYGNSDDGVVIIWTLTSITCEVSIYCLQDDHSKLLEALLKTRRLDWLKRRVVFCCVMSNLTQCVVDVFKTLNQELHNNNTYIAHIAKEKALAFDTTVPADVQLQPSILEHTATMDEQWPHRHHGSLHYFQQMIEWGAGLALVGADTADLRGWVLTSVRGDMHAVQVMQDHRRKGYAQLLLRTLGKQLAEANREVFGCIITENSASKEMFLKMGFELLFVTSWMFN